jgi:membrane protein YqaA with SNARE-associated domain
VTLLVATFFYCVLSALVPIVNAEAYVGAVAALADAFSPWLVAACAAGGQMVGKFAYYLLGRQSLRWSWVRKKTESPKWQARVANWQDRIGGNGWLAGGVCLLSGAVGIPPFAIVAVVAGQLRVPWPVFLLSGFLGRLTRFAAILGLVGYVLPGS